MKSLLYKDFSLRTHARGQYAKSATCCQFELTFGCNLHCRHCYTDCYNNSEFIKKELDIVEVKKTLDKIQQQGVVWLCFTGGDPLFRKDFPEIYAYAKSKGFLVTVFTSGYSVNKEILRIFKRQPPFVLEMTLNAVTRDLYERISGVRGSFSKVMENISALLKEKIPLKIKTQITRDNISHIPQIRRFISKLGLVFRPDLHLFARLNGDSSPCSLRVAPAKLVSIFGRRQIDPEICKDPSALRLQDESSINIKNSPRAQLFQCTLGAGQEFHIDPYGNMFLCVGLREPAVNVLKKNIGPVFNKLIHQVRGWRFLSGSKCAACLMRKQCLFCPGRAYLENGDMEAPSLYYCELTKSGVAQ